MLLETNLAAEKLANKTILLTGCNGFLGKRLLNVLIEIIDDLEESNISTNHHIYAIDNGITSSGEVPKKSKYISYYDSNAISFNYSELKSVDYVIHMAGLASPAQYKRFPLETIDVAVALSRTLLDKCIKWRSKFIFFSSSEIYGNPDPENIPTKESYKGFVSTLGPRSCYDESKRLGETLCYVYSNYYGVDTSIIRPFNIYGPGMNKKDYRMIPNLMRSAIEGNPITLYGTGNQTRTFCYLDDAIEGILRVVLDSPAGEVYNIGNPNPEISMIDLVDEFNKATRSNVLVELVDYPEHYPADEPLRRCPDISKASNNLGYKPSTTLVDGLAITYEWCSKNYK